MNIQKLENDPRSFQIFSGLLAAENIKVIHEPTISTAGFDVTKRILYLPVWKNISEHLYCLFIGHEVGHALFTPKESIEHFKDQTLKYCVNVIEDVRIDKLIQTAYPGLKVDYKVGYKELYDKKFFGVDQSNVASKSLLDRLNVHFKVKNSVELDVPFDEVEQKFVKKIDNCVSFESVVAVAKELCKYLNEKKQKEEANQKKKQEQKAVEKSDKPDSKTKEKETESDDSSSDSGDNEKSEPEDDSKDENESETEDSNDDSENESDSDSEGGSEDDSEDENESESESSSESRDDSETEDDSDSKDLNKSNSNSDSKDDSGDDTSESNDSSDARPNEDEMTTQDKLEEEIRKQFVSNTSRNLYDGNTVRKQLDYLDVPTSYDPIKLITPYKTYQPMITEHIESAAFSNRYYNNLNVEELSTKMISRNKGTVDYLVKEFELRKSAKINAKTKITKTGIINPDKLHTYKFNDDLFKKDEKTEKGKNHGVVLLVDMSGSMRNKLAATIEQTINLVMFCRKTRIPFEVFGFTSANDKSYDYYNVSETEVLIDKNIRIRNWFSSKMNMIEFNSAIKNFSVLAKTYDLPISEQMHYTPLFESLVVMNDYIGAFKNANSLDIVNLIVISDGEDSEGCTTRDKNGLSGNIKILKDAKTKNNVCIDVGYYNKKDYVDLILKLIKKNYNCNLIGFYLLPPNGKSELKHWIYCSKDRSNSEKMLEQYKANGFVTVKNTEYDSYFIVDSEKNFSVETIESLEKVDSTKKAASITRQFEKVLLNQVASRLLLRQFIELIS